MTTFDPKLDPYASSRETTEGTVFSVTGGDWDSLVSEIGESKEERIIVNMGPQHPSTHGVLRLVLELEGESVTEVRTGIGYLHTGIVKNIEFRNELRLPIRLQVPGSNAIRRELMGAEDPCLRQCVRTRLRQHQELNPSLGP